MRGRYQPIRGSQSRMKWQVSWVLRVWRLPSSRHPPRIPGRPSRLLRGRSPNSTDSCFHRGIHRSDEEGYCPG